MLLDHFHGILKQHRDWHGFHSSWAAAIATELNTRLPEGWYAEPLVQYEIEIDVSAYETIAAAVAAGDSEVESAPWVPHQPYFEAEFPSKTDVVRVNVFTPWGPRDLAGVIEIVSPANKDRPETREAFTSKCAAYLHDGVGLIVVDIVTVRHANMHRELVDRLEIDAPPHPGEEDDPPLYASAYHPAIGVEKTVLQVWYERLQIGQPLPSLPLFLKRGPCLEVNLNATYVQTCRSIRIPLPKSGQ